MKQRHVPLLPQTTPGEDSAIDSLPVSAADLPAALPRVSQSGCWRSQPVTDNFDQSHVSYVPWLAKISCAKELAYLLQEEILARILGLLQPCQLHWVERVNKNLRKTGKGLDAAFPTVLEEVKKK